MQTITREQAEGLSIIDILDQTKQTKFFLAQMEKYNISLDSISEMYYHFADHAQLLSNNNRAVVCDWIEHWCFEDEEDK